AAQSLPEGRYLVASIRLAPSGGWFGGKYYVDLLAPGVTEKFIEITLDAYRRELGEHFGKRLPGVFTDEPHLTPAGGIHWSQRLPNDFKERWGYDLMDHLPSLVRPLGDYRKVRHNFFQLLLELFIERWRVLRQTQSRIHRSLLGARLAGRRPWGRQYGNVRLASPAGNRHAYEPVSRGYTRPVW
ncbi:MAG: hypothetical protein ACYSW3_23020, partial [Planctomycetota bacterium]